MHKERFEEEQEFSFTSLFVPLTTLKAIHLIIFIGIVIFCNSFFNGFVGDDFLQIVSNPNNQSFQNFFSFFSGGTFYSGGEQNQGLYYRPLMLAFFASTYSLFGPNAFIFHFSQIFLFILCSVILFLVFKQFFRKIYAFILTLIFLVHPINSEIVFYISNTQDVLFLLFGLISLGLLQNSQSKKILVVSAIFILLSLLSKETGILFLCLAFIYVYLYKKQYILKFLFISISTFSIYLLLRVNALGIFVDYPKNAPIQELDLIGRLINMPDIFIFYIKTFFFPINLAVSYHWVHTQVNFNNFIFPLIISLLFLSVVFALAFILHKKSLQRYFINYIFFMSWFLLGIVLLLQFFPLDQTVADRWFLFPIIGVLGMIGVLLEAFNINLKNSKVIIIVGIVIILFSSRTIVRSFDWRDNLTLATHDLKVSKEAFNLEGSLSAIYLEKGLYKEAKLHAEKSIDIYPTLVNYNNLGATYFYTGQYQEAKKAFLNALKYGDYYKTYENLALLSLIHGDYKTNADFIKIIALKKYPQSSNLWFYLAVLEYIHGNGINAKYYVQQAVVLNSTWSTSSAYSAIINTQPFSIKTGKNNLPIL